ncbi:MAG: hypothetical protein IT374_18190 [Polyangiaceae bacterium]|nr:hypothetical protein [Polyangiaceae bacterium]
MLTSRLAPLGALALFLVAGVANAGAPVVTVTGAAEADATAVRAAVLRELAADTEGGAVDVRLDASAIEVTARRGDGRVLTRAVGRPADPSRVAETAALLAGNLLRDQTSDLEAELRRRRARETVAPASPPVSPAPSPQPSPPVAEACGAAGRTLPAFELAPGVTLPRAAGEPDTARAFTLALVGGHRGPTRGASIAAIGTYGSGGVCGVHLSGIFDWAYGAVRGVQVAGVAASARDVVGAQLGPLVRAAEDGRGVPAGVVEIARDVRGVQAGVVEIARDVRGVQVGVVNVARRARGAQLGVVNIADDSDAPIGLVNVIRNGRLHVDGWLLDLPGVAVGLVHGGRYTHSIYGIGARRGTDGAAYAVATIGAGAHVPVGARGYVDVDVLDYFLPDGGLRHVANVFQLRVVAGVAVSPGLSIFAGPTWSLSQSPPETAEELGVLGSRRLDWGGGAEWRTWPGLTAGVRAF